MDEVHKGILRKFEALKGNLIVGKNRIKGEDSKRRLPPDSFVPEEHILHGLVRGFYIPAKKQCMLSYQATESEENYGKQIEWEDENENNFVEIKMVPPNSPRDNRKVRDIKAARYNLENNIPIGILHKVKKGHNVILGLGKIITETEEGIFIIKPTTLEKLREEKIELMESFIDIDDLNTSVMREVTRRLGQDKFKDKLLKKSAKCALCNLENPFLVASHIKPWSKSDNFERLDADNGLLLCPNHDRLFDRGYISFKQDGSILISPEVSSIVKSETGLKADFNLKMNTNQKNYMKWHENNLYKTGSSSKSLVDD